MRGRWPFEAMQSFQTDTRVTWLVHELSEAERLKEFSMAAAPELPSAKTCLSLRTSFRLGHIFAKTAENTKEASKLVLVCVVCKYLSVELTPTPRQTMKHCEVSNQRPRTAQARSRQRFAQTGHRHCLFLMVSATNMDSGSWGEATKPCNQGER